MSNQELAAALGPLKRAAVDAYMKSQPGDWEVVGDKYENRSRNTLTTVSAPDTTTGSGGGDWRSNVLFATWMDQGKDADYEAAFDGVRSTLNRSSSPGSAFPTLKACKGTSRVAAMSRRRFRAKSGKTAR